MMINATAHSWRTSLAWSALSRAAGLLAFGLIGWLLLFPRVNSAWRVVSLIAVLAIAGLVGARWYVSHARAEHRWRAALDRYAERELANEIPSRWDSRAGARPKVR